MRVLGLAIAAVFLATVPLDAQDLQYRIHTRTILADSLPNSAGAFPDLTIFIKAKQLRVDVEIAMPTEVMTSTMLMDDSANTSFMVLHAEKSYMATPNPFGNVAAMTDSAAAKLGKFPAPAILRTGERARIAGYDAVRIVMTTEMPAGMPMFGSEAALFITESWIATDSVLNAAYRPFAQKSARMSGGTAAAEMFAAAIEGFPLRTTNIMMAKPATRPDPLAILEQERPAGLLMRMEMEVAEVKLGALPDSVFKVPAGYVQRGRN